MEGGLRRFLQVASLKREASGLDPEAVHTQPQKEQWDEAAASIEANADAGALVVVSPFWANESYHYYAERDDLVYASVPAGASGWIVTSATQGHSSVWLVLRGQNATQRERLLESLDRQGYERERQIALTELDVYHFVDSDV
jgi:hypothetical protein